MAGCNTSTVTVLSMYTIIVSIPRESEEFNTDHPLYTATLQGTVPVDSIYTVCIQMHESLQAGD